MQQSYQQKWTVIVLLDKDMFCRINRNTPVKESALLFQNDESGICKIYVKFKS